MKKWTAWLGFWLIWALPVQSEESHSHPPPEKLGKVSFPTSCSPTVARDFERSVALLHSFAYTASEQSFRKIAAEDPACAMAHWGIAMTYYHQMWSAPSPTELRDGQLEIEQALAMNRGTPRERQLIAAAAAYFKDTNETPSLRAKAYADAMLDVARNNPQDTEVQAFYALSLIATAPPEDAGHANQKRAAALLEPIFRTQPDHPGAAHYLIHAYDSAELASRGLEWLAHIRRSHPPHRTRCICHRTYLPDWVYGTIPLRPTGWLERLRAIKAIWAKSCTRWII